MPRCSFDYAKLQIKTERTKKKGRNTCVSLHFYYIFGR